MSADKIVEKALKDGREFLLEPEALELCHIQGLPITSWRFADNSGDAERLAKELGFPVVMKVVTSTLIHKSEIGGVALGLRNGREVKTRYKKMLEAAGKQPNTSALGVILQEQVPPGLEVIVGTFNDSQFGTCMTLGLGGVLAEFVPGATFRLVPTTENDAYEMISEVAEGKLLAGFKGQPPINREMLSGIILNVSRMVSELHVLDSVELNPIVLHEERGVVVDAKISLRRPNP